MGAWTQSLVWYYRGHLKVKKQGIQNKHKMKGLLSQLMGLSQGLSQTAPLFAYSDITLCHIPLVDSVSLHPPFSALAAPLCHWNQFVHDHSDYAWAQGTCILMLLSNVSATYTDGGPGVFSDAGDTAVEHYEVFALKRITFSWERWIM